VVPIADIYPRHTGFRHVEYPTYVVFCNLNIAQFIMLICYYFNNLVIQLYQL